MFVVRPRRRETEGKVPELHFGACVEKREELHCGCIERVRRLPGEHHELGRATCHRWGGDGGGLLHHDVRVRSAEPERADTGAPRPRPTRPRRRVSQHRDGQCVPRDVRTQRAELRLCGQSLLLEREDHLEEADHAGGSLEMTEVGFRSAEEKRSIGRPTFAISPGARSRSPTARRSRESPGPALRSWQPSGSSERSAAPRRPLLKLRRRLRLSPSLRPSARSYRRRAHLRYRRGRA